MGALWSVIVAVSKRRTRVIFFRVSDEEFQQLEKACESTGARSMSDFARLATRRLIDQQETADESNAVVERLDRIESAIERVEQKLREVGASGEQSAPARNAF
jgi:hypothetical protein